MAFPFARGGCAEQVDDRGRDVLDGALAEVASGLEVRAAADDRDRHILGQLGAVDAVVSAVIGGYTREPPDPARC